MTIGSKLHEVNPISETLLQHIEEYTSEDVVDVINKLFSVAKVDKLKRSVDIAKELHENIAASVTGVDAYDSLKSEVVTERMALAQQLQEALSTLQVLAIDTAPELAPVVDQSALQHVVEVAAQLHEDLVNIATSTQFSVQQATAEEATQVIEKTEQAQEIEHAKESIDTTQAVFEHATKVSEPIEVKEFAAVNGKDVSPEQMISAKATESIAIKSQKEVTEEDGKRIQQQSEGITAEIVSFDQQVALVGVQPEVSKPPDAPEDKELKETFITDPIEAVEEAGVSEQLIVEKEEKLVVPSGDIPELVTKTIIDITETKTAAEIGEDVPTEVSHAFIEKVKEEVSVIVSPEQIAAETVQPIALSEATAMAEAVAHVEKAAASITEALAVGTTSKTVTETVSEPITSQDEQPSLAESVMTKMDKVLSEEVHISEKSEMVMAAQVAGKIYSSLSRYFIIKCLE